MERSYRQNVSSDRYPTALRLIPETAAPSYPYEQSGNKNQPHISSSRPLSSSATSSVVYPTSVSQPQISLPSTDALLSFTSPVLGTQSNVSRVDPFLCPPSTRPDIQHPSLTSDFSLSPRPQASTQPLQLTNWSFPESQSSALNAASQIRSREAVPAKFQNTFTPYRSFLDSPSNMSSWNDYALQQGTSQPASRILYDTQMQVAPSQFSLSNMQNTNGMNRSSSLDYMGSLFNQPNAHSVAPMSTSAYKLPLPPNASPITYRRSSISQDVPVNLPVQRRSSVSVSYPSQTSSLVSSNPPHTVGQYSYQYPSPAYSPIPASRAIPSQHPPFPPPTAIPHHQPRSIDPFGSFPSYSSIVLPRPKEPESGVGPMAFELETSRKHKTYEAATGTPGAPRVCANCGTRDSPSWRRYGEGKDLLCNACGLYIKLHGTHRPVSVDADGVVRVVRTNVASLYNQCTNCGTRKTPLWRRGVNGEILCNACGLFYKQHKHHRPVSDSSLRGRHFKSSGVSESSTSIKKKSKSKKKKKNDRERSMQDDYTVSPDGSTSPDNQNTSIMNSPLFDPSLRFLPQSDLYLPRSTDHLSQPISSLQGVLDSAAIMKGTDKSEGNLDEALSAESNGGQSASRSRSGTDSSRSDFEGGLDHHDQQTQHNISSSSTSSFPKKTSTNPTASAISRASNQHSYLVPSSIPPESPTLSNLSLSLPMSARLLLQLSGNPEFTELQANQAQLQSSDPTVTTSSTNAHSLSAKNQIRDQQGQTQRAETQLGLNFFGSTESDSQQQVDPNHTPHPKLKLSNLVSQ